MAGDIRPPDSAAAAATMVETLALTAVARLRPRECVRLSASATAQEAVDTMSSHHQGAVVVEADDGTVKGIFTERDVLRLAADGDQAWLSSPVGDLMTASPVVVHGEDSVAETVRRMKESQYRHLPVVDDAGHATAIISIRDVLRFVSECYPQEISNLPPDPSLEARKLWGG